MQNSRKADFILHDGKPSADMLGSKSARFDLAANDDPAPNPANSTGNGNVAGTSPRLSGSRSLRQYCAARRLLLLALLCVVPAAAQQAGPDDLSKESMEDLVKMKVDSVYGATKFLQKTEDASSSVTVVTGEEIQKYGYRTLADVLQGVRGFYVINDRNYTYVGVRGLSLPGDYNARILFLLDGHRVNDNIFDGAYVGTEFPVDIDLIERIEIIRGPDSSAYGTGAFSAVINVITKRGRDLNALEISGEAGSWNSYKGRMSFGDRFDNGLETLLSGTFYNSQGHQQLFFPAFDSPATNNGIAENADGDQAYSAFGDFIYRDFNVHVVGNSRTKHVPTASFGTVFDDPRNQTTDARRYVDIQYHHTFGSWEMLGRLSYDWYGYHGIYVYDYAGKGSTFTVYLPRIEQAASTSIRSTPERRTFRGTETILLVEDAEPLRRLTQLILQENGYRVLAAEDGADAQKVAAEFAGPIQLLLTDVVMPGINGRVLAERLAPSHPAMKVLYMSGYTDSFIAGHGVLEPGTHLLRKPFTEVILLHKVRELLDGGNGARKTEGMAAVESSMAAESDAKLKD